MSNMGIKVGKARRKSVRDLQEPFGKDFNKYIAEIVTNSDDSYKRLEENGILNEHSEKNIDIDIKKSKNPKGYIIYITDQAEGLSKNRVEEIFTKYGGDNAGGTVVKSRGIFGQGASDVLFNSAYNKFPSLIETIKDGIVTKTKFYLNDDLDRFIDPQELTLSKHRLLQLRNNWGITENGTRVTFGIKDDVIGKKIDTIIRDLENFYSFRYIFSSSNRKITLNYNNKKYELKSSKYLFKEQDKILDNKIIYFQHEHFNIQCTINLYKTERENHDRTTILVRDQNYVVYANDFFRFDNNPRAKNISGELIINNLYDICKFYLNSEEKASAVLTDTRDGFDQKHSFYKDLLAAVSPIILDTIERFGKDVKDTDMTNNKKFSDALRDINKYLAKEIEEDIGGVRPGIKPPSDGLRFARPEIFINIGKTYSIPLYINPKMISEDETINIVYEQNDYIHISPISFSYSSEDINENDGIVVKAIRVESKKLTNNPIIVQAKSEIYKSELIINVIDKDIFYPVNGMEFHSNIMRVKPEEIHIAKLYVDTSIIPIGSKININNSEEMLLFQTSSVTVEESQIVADNIAMIRIHYNPKLPEGDYTVNAEFDKFEARLDIQVRLMDDPNPGTRGIINGFKLSPGKAYYQSYFQPYEKIIYIMQENYINQILMPQLSDLDSEKPNPKKDERKIITDILANEIAILLVNKQIEKGKIAIDVNGQEEYLNRIRQEKTKIFKILYKVLE